MHTKALRQQWVACLKNKHAQTGRNMRWGRRGCWENLWDFKEKSNMVRFVLWRDLWLQEWGQGMLVAEWAPWTCEEAVGGSRWTWIRAKHPTPNLVFFQLYHMTSLSPICKWETWSTGKLFCQGQVISQWESQEEWRMWVFWFSPHCVDIPCQLILKNKKYVFVLAGFT